MNNKT